MNKISNKKNDKKIIVKNIFFSSLLSLIIIILEINKNIYLVLCKFDTLNNILITMIAAIFGFTIAAIPFVLSTMEKNTVIQELLEDKWNKNNIFIPFLNRFPDFLTSMVMFFVVIIFFISIKDFYFKDNITLVTINIASTFTYLLILFYLYFTIDFIKKIYRLAKDLKKIVDFYIEEIK